MPRSTRRPKSAGYTQPDSPPPSPAPLSRLHRERPRTARSRRPTAGWLVYMLRCRDGSLYTGITNDLTRRLAAHASGKASRYTRSRLPVSVAYQEPQPTKSRALTREAAIKKLSRQRKERLADPDLR